MNTDDITKLRELLERYYAAALSPDEEGRLWQLLSDPGLPEEFLADRKMMEVMSILLPRESFETKLSQRIDAIVSEESGGKHILRRRFSTIMRWGAAAALAALIGVATLTWIMEPITQPTQLSPKETYEQTTMALLIFAEALEKGCNAIEMADSTTADATSKAIDALSTLGTFISEN